MRVLIIQTAPLGGILSALPILDFLHQAVSEVEVDWVVDEEYRAVLEGNPLLSTLHTVRTGEWRNLPRALSVAREIGQLKETLIAREYRFVFDLEGSFNSGLIGRLTGAQDKIGFEKSELADRGNLFFSMRRVPLRRQDANDSHKYLRLVSIPFAKDFRAMELSSGIITEAADDLAAEALLATLSDGLVFLFDCGADWQTKLWSEQGWLELARQVVDTFHEVTILLCWETEAEKELATKLAKAVTAARVLDRQTLKGMAALLKKVDLVVGGDNDTVKMAAALGTPTVSFYRATDAKRRGPIGEHHVVVQSPIHCARCLRANCDKDTQCRGTIKTEALLAGIRSLFSS
ncbi:glycosyltransferase family 9 protein [Geomonas sp.]|uniref:glycosyltransferase family 9 protein n=1 Tax=Geomonas sp. TaxID=2651584 RepID=UPI002B486CA8|nr:glycosyltransferase family 9 protein [Geomonas sp.]HJV35500.1 glycosyltransferase family 9 protein [Geomonas sp.]